MNNNKKEEYKEYKEYKKEAMDTSDYEFLQEKIKERPINKKKLLKRTITTASLAVLFGLLACLSFLLLEPVLNNWIYPEEEPEIVTFPPEKNEKLPEDMLTEDTATSQEKESGEEQAEQGETDIVLSEAASETGDGEKNSETSDAAEQGTEKTETEKTGTGKFETGKEEIQKTEPEKTDADENDAGGEKESEPESVLEPLKPYQTQYEELYNIYKETASSMVTVTGVHSDVDWFNNPYQSEGSTAGVIIANNNRELLILSRKSPLDGAETIRISFCNGTSADAAIKHFDQNTDLAVLAVDLKYIKSSTLEQVSVAVLGSSSFSTAAGSGITGTPVIAIGNLFGYKDNVCYGIITSSGNPVSMVDSEYKLITTDIYAGTNPSGILVNMDREVIGIIDNRHNHDDTKNLLSAIGITELKGMIAKLSNGEPIPYLGIYVQDVDAQVRTELGLPQGAYIFDIDMDSPAMLKGIQKGDILVRVGILEIRSAADYTDALRNVQAERSIDIVVQRASINAYEEMHFAIQTAAR